MIIIGEKINATRKSIKRAIAARDRAAISSQIEAQDTAGAKYIDLNGGTGEGDQAKEAEDLCWLIDVALESTEKALAIDSANPEVIVRAAEHLGNRRPWMLNSIKHSDNILQTLLPLAADQKVPTIALAMDGDGIPETAEQRLTVCQKICNAAEKAGVALSALYFDPLIMPLSADHRHAKVALETLGAIKHEFPDVHTTIGTSNVSFGLVERARLNGAFLLAAMSNGVDSAICDPTRAAINQAILLGSLLTGKDKYCRKFTRAVRNGAFT